MSRALGAPTAGSASPRTRPCSCPATLGCGTLAFYRPMPCTVTDADRSSAIVALFAGCRRGEMTFLDRTRGGQLGGC